MWRDADPVRGEAPDGGIIRISKGIHTSKVSPWVEHQQKYKSASCTSCASDPPDAQNVNRESGGTGRTANTQDTLGAHLTLRMHWAHT